MILSVVYFVLYLYSYSCFKEQFYYDFVVESLPIYLRL